MASFLVPDGIDDPWYGTGNSFKDERDSEVFGQRRKKIGDVGHLPSIERLVAMNVLPKLKSLQDGVPVEGNGTYTSYRRPTDDEVILFSDIAIHCDTDASLKFILMLLDRGVPIESVYLDLISPAAKFLGEMWVEDRCDFAHVTLGTSCLQRTLSLLSDKFASQRDILSNRSALVMTMPGDQHTLGPALASEFLRRYGWDVECLSPETEDDAYAAAKSQDFDLIGFSVAHTKDLERLPEMAKKLRASIDDRNVGILAGGSAVLENADLLAGSEIDGLAGDGRETVINAGKIFDTLRIN